MRGWYCELLLFDGNVLRALTQWVMSWAPLVASRASSWTPSTTFCGTFHREGTDSAVVRYPAVDTAPRASSDPHTSRLLSRSWNTDGKKRRRLRSCPPWDRSSSLPAMTRMLVRQWRSASTVSHQVIEPADQPTPAAVAVVSIVDHAALCRFAQPRGAGHSWRCSSLDGARACSHSARWTQRFRHRAVDGQVQSGLGQMCYPTMVVQTTSRRWTSSISISVSCRTCGSDTEQLTDMFNLGVRLLTHLLAPGSQGFRGQAADKTSSILIFLLWHVLAGTLLPRSWRTSSISILSLVIFLGGHNGADSVLTMDKFEFDSSLSRVLADTLLSEPTGERTVIIIYACSSWAPLVTSRGRASRCMSHCYTLHAEGYCEEAWVGEGSVRDAEWSMDMFLLDLSLVARLGGHSALEPHWGGSVSEAWPSPAPLFGNRCDDVKWLIDRFQSLPASCRTSWIASGSFFADGAYDPVRDSAKQVKITSPSISFSTERTSGLGQQRRRNSLRGHLPPLRRKMKGKGRTEKSVFICTVTRPSRWNVTELDSSPPLCILSEVVATVFELDVVEAFRTRR